MKQKRIWIVLAGLVVVLLIGIFIVQHFLDADTYRGRIEAALSDALGRPVQLGHLSVSLLTGNLVAEALSIADDPSFFIGEALAPLNLLSDGVDFIGFPHGGGAGIDRTAYRLTAWFLLHIVPTAYSSGWKRPSAIAQRGGNKVHLLRGSRILTSIGHLAQIVAVAGGGHTPRISRYTRTAPAKYRSN